MGNKVYENHDDLPVSMPIFPLSGALLLPGGQMPLNIFEPRYLAMIDAALAGDRLIGMIQPSFDQSGGTNSGLCAIGCAGRIISFSETGDGRCIITLEGVCRFAVKEEMETTTPFRQIVVDWLPHIDDLQDDESEDDVDRAELLKAMSDFLTANNMEADWDSVNNAPLGTLVNALSMMSPYGPMEKQALLEAKNVKVRAETLIAITEMSLASTAQSSDATLQ